MMVQDKNRMKMNEMNLHNSKIEKVLLFSGGLTFIGGGEKLLLEEAKYLEKNGIETHIVTFNFRKEALFNGTYDVSIERIGHRTKIKNLLLRVIQLTFNIFALRKKIKEIKPDAIILLSPHDCMYFYFATLCTSFSYVTHIHETMFWTGISDDLTKYAFIYRKVFNEVREFVIGHKEFISIKPPKTNLAKRILNEAYNIATYLGVRKAKKIFVLSNQMRWEVKKLYGKNAVVLKGAFPSEIFNYQPKLNIKEILNLIDKRVILNVNRLVRRKRVDLLIKAFKQVSERFQDVVLIVGGVGPEESNLKALAKELNIQERVKFIGYIKEEELWDYYVSCDIFAHPDHADFDISAYQALALQRKVVWSSEMEIDEHLSTNRHIFPADPMVDDFAKAIEKALITDIREYDDVSMYTWGRYFGKIIKELKNIQ